VHATGWSQGLDVTADGQGIVSHAGLVLLRALADRTGLTGGLSRALATSRLLVHDRGRVLADLAAAIASGAEVISDFAVVRHQEQVLGPVASVPTAWRALDEIAAGGPRAQARITRAVNAARRSAWAAIEARHGAIPGIAIADRVLEGVTCIRLDATVVPAHSDKAGAEPNFKGYGHHPLLAYCDNTREALAGMMRRGSAGSNTVTDHLQVLDAAITAVPPRSRRRLMVTCGHQLRVADRLVDRRHPAGLAPAPGPRRRPGQSRAENPPLPHPARRRPAHPQRTATTAQDPRHLALGPGHRRRLDPDRRPAPGTLTSRKPSLRSPKDKNRARGTPATRPASRAAVIPRT
jgi:Transposase DDE domain group 1